MVFFALPDWRAYIWRGLFSEFYGNCFTVNENWKRRHSLKPALDSGLWTLARKVYVARLVMVFKGLYSTTNDPKNGPQMILDRKLEWFGIKLLDNRVMFIITTKSIKQKKI